MAKPDDKADVWMPLYIGDYLADTSRLTTEQHGAYFLLMMDYWRNGPPPDDEEILQNITRLSKFLWKKHGPVLRKFFLVEDGVWKQKRIDEEMVKAASDKASASEKGRNAANARWGNTGAQGNAQELPEQYPSSSPSPSPSSNNSMGQSIVNGANKSAHDDFRPKDAAEWLSHFKRKHGFEADPHNVADRKKLWPVFSAWTNAGLTTDFVDLAVTSAQQRAKEPIACLPLYVDRLMASEQSARDSPRPRSYHDDRKDTIEGLTGRNQRHEHDTRIIDIEPVARLAR